MTTQCVVRAAECNSPWRGKCPKDKRGPSPARGTSRNETPDIQGGTYCLIKYRLYVIPSGFAIWVSLIHRYGKVSFATIVATPFMRSITSFAIRQHRFPTANENDICAFGAKWCSSLRSEIRPYGSRSPFPAREG